MDETRLADLLRPRHIVTDLRASTVEGAIEALVERLARTGELDAAEREVALASALERERESSTCFGGGLAVPHAVLDGGDRLRAAMGLSSEGLPFATPDGRPVHCLVLLVTPPGGREEHLRVLGYLAARIGLDAEFASRLFAADSPASAHAILGAAVPTT